jgi:hypothetical protein
MPRLTLRVVLRFALLLPLYANAVEPRHVVLVVWDGMRPDFATAKFAPTLDQLARAGVRFAAHHSVYPTETDVNGAALATGCYPDRSGLCANLEFRPEINPRLPVDTSGPESLRRGDELSGGKYLLVPTFVERLREAGKTVALAGTKAVALLFDRHNDWTIVPMQNRAFTVSPAHRSIQRAAMRLRDCSVPSLKTAMPPPPTAVSLPPAP